MKREKKMSSNKDIKDKNLNDLLEENIMNSQIYHGEDSKFSIYDKLGNIKTDILSYHLEIRTISLYNMRRRTIRSYIDDLEYDIKIDNSVAFSLRKNEEVHVLISFQVRKHSKIAVCRLLHPTISSNRVISDKKRAQDDNI
jgi:hypothetical protein